MRVDRSFLWVFPTQGGLDIRRRYYRFEEANRDRTRVNHRIRIPEVRVIGADGEQLGVMPTSDAQARANGLGLDLVEVAPTARPPVCRIMDYGKYKFEQAKKSKEAKAKQHRVKVKEVKMRLKISDHDYDFKIRHAIEFLQDGNKVKFRVLFRGREMSRPERGEALIDRITQTLEDYGVVESRPKGTRRELLAVMMGKPGVRKNRKAAKVAEAEDVTQTVEEPVEETKESRTDRPRSIMATGLARAARRKAGGDDDEEGTTPEESPETGVEVAASDESEEGTTPEESPVAETEADPGEEDSKNED